MCFDPQDRTAGRMLLVRTLISTQPKRHSLRCLGSVSTHWQSRRHFSQTGSRIDSAQEPAQEWASKSEVMSLSTTNTSPNVEKFIPVTRRTLLRVLMKDSGLLNSEQKMHMEKVAAALDAKYSKRFYSILEQAKVR